MEKQRFLDVAEAIDSFRVIPRMLLFAYCGVAYHWINGVLDWYMRLPLASQNLQNAGLITGVSAILTGFGTFVFSIYSSNGRDWNAKTP